MAKVIAGMTMSLDGFVSDANGSVAQLYPDLAALQGTHYMNAEIKRTGAVLMGRRTFEMGDPDSYVGNYEFQVPIVVLTHRPPTTAPKQDERLTFTFSDELGSAIDEAKAAAGEAASCVCRDPCSSEAIRTRRGASAASWRQSLPTTAASC